MRTLAWMPLCWIVTTACGGRDSIDCDTLTLEVPSARGEVGGVWDAARERLVVFGGDEGTPVNCQSRTAFVGETWAFHSDCDGYESLTPAGAPSARGRHATALDTGRNQMLIHGGRFRDGTSGLYTLLDDLHAYDLTTDTWAPLVGDGPSARTNHTLVVAGDRAVLYGGNTSRDGAAFRPQGDVWTYDLAAGGWTEVTTAGDSPGARLFHAAAVSDDGGTMYVYGGGGTNAFLGPFFGDLWALDLGSMTWTELHDGRGAGVPMGRIWPNLITDGDRLLLWAGHDDGALGNTNQLWAFDLGASSWSLLEEGDTVDQPANGFCDFPADFVVADLEAPERRNAGVAALTGPGELIVFGGKSDCGLLNDVWSWSSDGWVSRSRATTGEICQRAFQECDTLCF